MDGIFAGIGIPIATFTDRIPLRFCPLKRNTRQAIAIIEHITPYTRYTVGYGDTRQAIAIIERTISYTSQLTIFTECDTRQTTAIRERTISYTRYAVRYCYTR